MNIDKWEWAYAFFRGCLDLDEEKSTQAANLVTDEERVVDEEGVVKKFKDMMAVVHERVGCEKCRPNTSRN